MRAAGQQVLKSEQAELEAWQVAWPAVEPHLATGELRMTYRKWGA